MIRVLFVAVLAILVLPACWAQQAPPPFLLQVTQGGASTIVQPGATIAIGADAVNREATAQIVITNRAGAAVTFTALDVAGSADFSLSGNAVPRRLSPGESFTVTVRYRPASTRAATAVFTAAYEVAPTSGTAPPVTGSFTLALSGAVADMSVVYLLQTDANPIAVTDGGTIAFPATPANTSTTATVVVLNRGTAPLDLRSISLTQSGSDFQVLGLPLLPGFLDPGRDVRFTVRYAPRQSGTSTATLQISSSTQTLTATVQGTSIGPQFTYELIDESTQTALVPNTPFTLPDTRIGETRSFVVRVRNVGDGEGQITGISVLGPGFQLTDLPFLPVTLVPGSSVFFTLNFAPTVPGRVIGRMRIGNDTFEMSATVLGPQLSFSVNQAGTEVPVQPNGTINFPTIPVGSRSTAQVTITNTGTTSAVFSSIGSPSTEFRVIELPPLPATIAPNQNLTFRLLFNPSTTGPITSTLRADNFVFNLSGFAGTPPDLPPYRIEGLPSVVDPLQQPAVSLTLDAPYAIDLTGTLNLSFNSESFAVDPALQFINGGRSVNFTIPANSTRALFGNNSTQIRLQTGTVAGSIVLSPTFATAGGINVTPNAARSASASVAARTPAVVSADVTASGPNTFVLSVTGYSVSRTLTRLNAEFAVKNGQRVSATQQSFDITTPATLWYRSTASQGFGSLFTATVPFTVQGLPATNLISDFLESVTVSLANELGTSNTVRVQVR
jgi:hypothetical protein